ALFVKELEKRQNVKITFQGPPSSNTYNDAVNTMLASGDITDLIVWDWRNYAGGLDGAVKDGIVFNFTAQKECMDQLPNFLKRVGANELVRLGYTQNDGSLMPVFCTIQEGFNGTPYSGSAAYQGLAIRQDWLDRLGLKVPRTVDELYTVLSAFKRQDANGNGDPNDEIPYSSNNPDPRSFNQLIAAWGLRNNMFYPDPQNPGKLTYWTLYKNGQAFTAMLTALSQWYREGLLDTDFFTQNNNARISKVTSDKVGVSYTDPTNGADWRDAIKKLRPEIADKVKFTGLQPLIGPEGKPYASQDNLISMANTEEATVITRRAEREGKIPAILKLIDYMYSDEGSVLSSYGVEGVSYTRDAQGRFAWTPEMSLDPQFPLKSKLLQYAVPYIGRFPRFAFYEAWRISNTYDTDAAAIHAEYLKADFSILMPVVTLSQDQSEEYNRLMADINTAVNEFYVSAITGRRPVSDAPAFFAQLQSMGLGRAQEIYQAAYTQFMSR
ncbi:MAG: extracellular solute-binding protein, partial [Treponema sp.]|nr:extracellular solute-binding protein [Treponema sp.]